LALQLLATMPSTINNDDDVTTARRLIIRSSQASVSNP